jgi:hypothetical protein
MTVRQRATDFLAAHGAGDIRHPGGTLLAHLQRTADTLIDWGASEPLTLAGLCHAAYGTDGLATFLIDTSQRQQLVSVIGEDAEATVYFYAACDRSQFYPQLGLHDRPRFRDRFTAREHIPDAAIVRNFVELTFANELDVLANSPELTARYGNSLAELFTRCRKLASAAANSAANTFIQSNQPLL